MPDYGLLHCLNSVFLERSLQFCEVQFAIYFMIHVICVLAKKSMPNSGSHVFLYI